MALSLNLPYVVCYPLTRLARRLQRNRAQEINYDKAAYFEYQHGSTERLRQRYLQRIDFKDQVVLDLGSGLGGRAPYFLKLGAKAVLCIDINREELQSGRDILARKFPELVSRTQFLHPSEVKECDFADLAILFDSFEHLVDPAHVLRDCHRWLRPGGKAWIGSLGWYHHDASHCRSHIPIPWCQLIFSERAIIRTIRTLIRDPSYVPNVWERAEGLTRWDGVESLKDRPGEPLNMLSLRGVRRVLEASPFSWEFEVHGFSGEANPLAKWASLLSKVPWINEVFHSSYTALLTKPEPTRQISST
jgi:SAM-dependent methyltransferase